LRRDRGKQWQTDGEEDEPPPPRSSSLGSQLNRRSLDSAISRNVMPTGVAVVGARNESLVEDSMESSLRPLSNIHTNHCEKLRERHTVPDLVSRDRVLSPILCQDLESVSLLRASSLFCEYDSPASARRRRESEDSETVPRSRGANLISRFKPMLVSRRGVSDTTTSASFGTSSLLSEAGNSNSTKS
jgi:hypothetical protein